LVSSARLWRWPGIWRLADIRLHESARSRVRVVTGRDKPCLRRRNGRHGFGRGSVGAHLVLSGFGFAVLYASEGRWGRACCPFLANMLIDEVGWRLAFVSLAIVTLIALALTLPCVTRPGGTKVTAGAAAHLTGIADRISGHRRRRLHPTDRRRESICSNYPRCCCSSASGTDLAFGDFVGRTKEAFASRDIGERLVDGGVTPSTLPSGLSSQPRRHPFVSDKMDCAVAYISSLLVPMRHHKLTATIAFPASKRTAPRRTFYQRWSPCAAKCRSRLLLSSEC
jgi:hypothetical protein